MLAGFAFVLLILTFVPMFMLHRRWRAIRLLRGRTVTELGELLSEVDARHLILSHLADSLPSTPAWQFDKARINELRVRAEQARKRIDPTHPIGKDFRAFSTQEQSLFKLEREVIGRIEADESVRCIESVAGCLDGLKRVGEAMIDSGTTYNTAAITYNQCCDSSGITRLLAADKFALCDLEPRDSGIGHAEYVRS